MRVPGTGHESFGQGDKITTLVPRRNLTVFLVPVDANTSMSIMGTNESGDAVDENDTNENSAVANVLRTEDRQQE